MFNKHRLILSVFAALLFVSGHALAGDDAKAWKDYFDVSKGGKLEDSKRIMVAGYHCGFVIQTGAYAGGRNVKVSMNMLLGGIKKEDLQEIADSAYAAFLAQIKATGREVVSYDELRATKAYAKWDTTALEPGKIFSKQYTFAASKTYVVVSPKAIPLAFTHVSPINDRSAFGIGNAKAMWAMADEVKAILVVPLITIDIANFEGSGASMFTNSANLEAGQLISTEIGRTIYNFYGPSYGYGNANLIKKPIIADGPFGVFDESPEAYNHFDIGSALSSFDKGGVGVQVIVADPPKFKERVLQVHALAGKYFCQVLDKYKPD